MNLDQNTTNVLLGLFGLLNTALLVYQAIRLQSVHNSVGAAKDAAVESATLAGVAAGMSHAPPPTAATPPASN